MYDKTTKILYAMGNSTVPLESLAIASQPHAGTEAAKQAIEAVNKAPGSHIVYEECTLHDFPMGLCPYCKDTTIVGLQKEIERLKKGQFSPEELQNLCHNSSQDDANAFGLGCFDYQVQLFGPMKVRELYLRVRSEYIKLFRCECCGSVPDDDGRLLHCRACDYKPGEFEDIQDLLVRKSIVN